MVMSPVRALHSRHPPLHQKMKMFSSEPSYAWWEFAIPTQIYSNFKVPLRLIDIDIDITIVRLGMNPVTVVGYCTGIAIAEYGHFFFRHLAVAVATDLI